MDTALTAPALFEQPQQDEQAAKHKRNLNLALQHALLIQHQKDVEAQILLSIEVLTDTPAANEPTQQEHEVVVKEVAIFQPSDFDDLINERTSQSRCGYVLCDRQPRSLTTRVWQLAAGAADFCSDSCQRKAAYVRAQLSTIPAWERGPLEQVQIILDEDKAVQRPRVNANAELAFERGEKASSLKPGQVMTTEIVEKITNINLEEVQPPNVNSTNAIEGYIPKHEQEDLATTLPEMLPHIETAHDNEKQHHGPDDEEQQWADMFAHLQK